MSICCVNALDRETAPLFGLFLASLVISIAIPVKLAGPDPRLRTASLWT